MEKMEKKMDLSICIFFALFILFSRFVFYLFILYFVFCLEKNKEKQKTTRKDKINANGQIQFSIFSLFGVPFFPHLFCFRFFSVLKFCFLIFHEFPFFWAFFQV